MNCLIIGGGIIGLSTARFLIDRGCEVRILEKTDGSDGCSTGNAGMITPSHFVPLASPGMVSQGIRWMFDSKSPFFVRPRLSLDLVDWGLKFMRSATARHVENSGPPLVELSLLSKSIFLEWLKIGPFDCDFAQKGIVMYFKTAKTGDEEIHLAEKARAVFGLDVEILSRENCRSNEPFLKPDVLGGVHYRCDATLHPQAFIRQLKADLEARGVRFFYEKEVTGMEKKGRRVAAVFCENERFEADSFVLAAGSWSAELAKKFDLKLPMQPGKGYSITLEHVEKQLNLPAILCEARVAMTPMGHRLRLGGTMEIDSLSRENRINRTRMEGILAGVASFFPDLNMELTAEKHIWHGLRPLSPDGLPFIGRAKNLENLFIGTGHAMMGLGLGPATGRLISELIFEEKPAMNLSVFEPGRFD